MLLSAEDVARSAYLEVLHRYLETASEFGISHQRVQTFARVLGEYLPLSHREIGVREVMAPAHSAAQLVKLRKSQPVRVYHDKRVGVGNVYAVLDYRCGYQYVRFLVVESAYPLLEQCVVHLSVRVNDAGVVAEKIAHLAVEFLYALNSVEEYENLPAATEFAGAGVLDKRVGTFDDVGFDG